MKTYIKKLQQSFGFAFSGITYVLKTQSNSWIHLFFTILVIFAGFLLKITILQWVAIFFCFAMVWLSEFFNTSLEVLVDLASPQYHPLAKRCKDIAAGAVLIAAICSIIIGVLVLGPPIYQAIFIR